MGFFTYAGMVATVLFLVFLVLGGSVGLFLYFTRSNARSNPASYAELSAGEFRRAFESGQRVFAIESASVGKGHIEFKATSVSLIFPLFPNSLSYFDIPLSKFWKIYNSVDEKPDEILLLRLRRAFSARSGELGVGAPVRTLEAGLLLAAKY